MVNKCAGLLWPTWILDYLGDFAKGAALNKKSHGIPTSGGCIAITIPKNNIN